MSDQPTEAQRARSEHFAESIVGKPNQRARCVLGNVLYAWQMEVDDGWNIIGATAPGTGMILPLVTTSVRVAWEAMEIAQAHANANQCQVRLAAFGYGETMAVVVPNE